MCVANGRDAVVSGFYRDFLRVMSSIVGSREITAQECALDAYGLPLITYSCDAQYFQIKSPQETVWTIRRQKEIEKRARFNNSSSRTLEDIAYEPPVVKYVKSTS